MSRRSRENRAAQEAEFKRRTALHDPAIPPYILQNNTPTQAQLAALRDLKIMLAVPMYGGMCMGNFASSLLNLGLWADRLGMILHFSALYNESLVQRARNTLTYSFIKSDCEYLMFIDADITFNPASVIELLLCAKMNNEPLIGATYSKKSINIPALRAAIAAGVKDDNLLHCSGDHVIRPMPGEGKREVKFYEPFPVLYLGTGFMLIHRSVFTRLDAAKKADGTLVVLPYNNNHIPRIPSTELISPYFDCESRIDETGKRIYLSEDYLFCARAIDAGITPKLALWVLLAHNGTFAFEGCYTCTQGGYDAHSLLDHLK